ncbi:BMP family protein [Paraliobacillus sp. JSM ZJ581]|uniref:BMP family lipoprotein n=1 Tax=Paraliobacillus sp. JSM ZJ581 TaxID=3342118 RepID=UPI0035A96A7C
MKKNRLLLLFGLLLSAVLVLSACGGSDDTDKKDEGTDGSDEKASEETTDFKVSMVTDVGGVDDKSFNQSSWEGLEAFGEEHGLEEKVGYDYAQSDQDADFLPNLNRLVKQDFNLIFGVGFKLAEALDEVASQNPDTHFAIVDSVVEGDNIASITFAEHQGSFLVGVAAAMKSETGKVGFIGGEESDLIKKFEAGFVAGVASVDPEIKVEVDYAESFAAPDKGKAIAANMYNNDVDVIYHSSGATGNGVFAQAKDIKNGDPDRNVWVIGVDRDQHDEGAINDTNVTLTSMIKRVDTAVQTVSNQALNGEFPGGEILTFGIEEEGIGVADTNEEAYTDEIDTAVQDWKEKILNGDVAVPSTDEELKTYLEAL